MKTRVIVKRGKFVPQIKNHWYTTWCSLGTYGGDEEITPTEMFCYRFDTCDDAVACIYRYEMQQFQNAETEGKVVWTGET